MGSAASQGINAALSEAADEDLRAVIRDLSVDVRDRLEQSVRLEDPGDQFFQTGTTQPSTSSDLLPSWSSGTVQDDEAALRELDVVWAYEDARQMDEQGVASERLKVVGPLGYGGPSSSRKVNLEGITCVAKKTQVRNESEALEILATVQALQKIQHANIIKLLGVVVDQPGYIVTLMELAPLRGLDSFIRIEERGVTGNPKIQRQLLRGIAAGMACLHSQTPPILHGDLKPSNIMIWPDVVTGGFMPKLSDICAITEEDRKMGVTGTPVYHAPEVLSDGEFTTASEVYAFAITGYEVLTGKPPWPGGSIIVIYCRVTNNERPIFPEMTDGSGEFVPLIERCWLQEPDRRPTFVEVLESAELAELGTEKGFELLRAGLREFDRTLAAALRMGLVRLISCDFLLAQSEGWKLPRMQELREIAGALLEPTEAVSLLEKADRSIFALSHGWLSRNHPDPYSVRLQALCKYLGSLRRTGKLSPGAGLFWDFGSLPQKPRTADEESKFRQALRIMGDVYASPLGTSVIQVKLIPPRPPVLDGGVLACELQEHIDTTKIREALLPFGELCEFEHIADSSLDAKARYLSHQSAISAAEYNGYENLLGDGAFVCLQYNERPYAERGWCVAEEMFSTECLLRLALPSMLRPKVVSLLDGGEVSEVKPQLRSAAEVEEAIGLATFTGKGDRKTVLQIHLTYQRRLLDCGFA